MAMVKPPSRGIGMNSNIPSTTIFEEQEIYERNGKVRKIDHFPNKANLNNDPLTDKSEVLSLQPTLHSQSSLLPPSRMLTASSVLEESAIESECARKIKLIKLPACAVSQLLELPPIAAQDLNKKTFDHRNNGRNQRKQNIHHLPHIIPSLVESYQQFAVDNQPAMPHFNWSKGRIHQLPRLSSHKKDDIFAE